MNLAETIKTLREKSGLSQQAAADAAGVTQPYWHELEAGKKTNPSYDVLQRIAAALGTTAAKLLR